jgi:hypothetical protein
LLGVSRSHACSHGDIPLARDSHGRHRHVRSSNARDVLHNSSVPLRDDVGSVCAIGFLPVELLRLNGVLVPVAEDEREPVDSVPLLSLLFRLCAHLVLLYSFHDSIVYFTLSIVCRTPLVKRSIAPMNYYFLLRS